VSREPRIDAYIAKAQPFARPILEKVRERVHATVPDIAEATVYSERHPLIGQIVCATVTPLKHADTDAKELVTIVKRHCASKLPPFKIPIKIRVVSDVQHTQRFKKARAV